MRIETTRWSGGCLIAQLRLSIMTRWCRRSLQSGQTPSFWRIGCTRGGWTNRHRFLWSMSDIILHRWECSAALTKVTHSDDKGWCPSASVVSELKLDKEYIWDTQRAESGSSQSVTILYIVSSSLEV